MDGKAFGHYRLLTLLGRGGMGEVWRAHDTTIDRIVAVKVLLPQLSQDHSFAERFRREARAVAQLNSPHIIPIHHHGEIDGQLYVDMRLIEGHDLDKVIANRPLEPARALRIIDQIAKALHATHKIGLIHRDVKPSNILLDEDDYAYLIDFGIAQDANQPGLTDAGAVIGSWHYMAPERMSANQVDARSDVYALTCVLYEALTGQRPYPGDSMESQIAAHLTAAPPRPTATNPELPASFDAVIGTGMAKHPEHRYRTTVDLSAAARHALADRQPHFGPPPQRPHWPVANTDPIAATQHRPPHENPRPIPPPLWPDPPPAAPTSTPRRRWPRKPLLITTAIVIVIAIAITITITTEPTDPDVAGTTALRFTGLNSPAGVAVGIDNTIYVADTGNNRVLKMTPRARTQVELPFTGLNKPTGVAVDADGDVFVVDAGNERVLKLAAGATAARQLFALQNASDVAVDTPGSTLYVTTNTDYVQLYPIGSNSLTSIQVGDSKQIRGIALSADRTIYVIDAETRRVLKGTERFFANPTLLPFYGVHPGRVAVDLDNTVYVTDPDNHTVLELLVPLGSPSKLPFTELNQPTGVAVGSDGAVYVTDIGLNQVLRLRR